MELSTFHFHHCRHFPARYNKAPPQQCCEGACFPDSLLLLAGSLLFPFHRLRRFRLLPLDETTVEAEETARIPLLVRFEIDELPRFPAALGIDHVVVHIAD